MFLNQLKWNDFFFKTIRLTNFAQNITLPPLVPNKAYLLSSPYFLFTPPPMAIEEYGESGRLFTPLMLSVHVTLLPNKLSHTLNASSYILVYVLLTITITCLPMYYLHQSQPYPTVYSNKVIMRRTTNPYFLCASGFRMVIFLCDFPIDPLRLTYE